MKVLIWTKQIELKNIGGPSGYLYNIKKYLDLHPQKEISFYPIEYHVVKKTYNGKFFVEIRNFIKRILYPFLFVKCLYDNYFSVVSLSEEDTELLSKYDFVHVHYLSHILQSFTNYNNKSTKIILTTHNPEPLIDQLAEEFHSKWVLKVIPFFRNYFIMKEIKAYEIVDFIMFPVEESIEPYINRSNLYQRRFKELRNKFFFTPTAINEIDLNFSDEHLLYKYNIPSSALKICYIGRHNTIKGYDTIKEAAKHIWNVQPNIYFVIGGKEEPLKGMQDPRWLELGWVNTQSLLNEIDVFILPNKDTYFDLILLEVLRQGVPVILTRTGGNKWFEKRNKEAMFYYSSGNINELVGIVNDLYNRKEELSSLRVFNRAFFEREHTMDKYIKLYLSNLHSLLPINEK